MIRHEVLDAVFFGGGGGPAPDGFRPVGDSFGHDYRSLIELAEDRARVEGDSPVWEAAYPWLARATGRGCEVVDGFGFRYGPAFTLGTAEVREVAAGLAREHWSRSVRAADWDVRREDQDLDDLVPFFAAAATEGRCVIGGVS
ncbi:hypothetical protein JNUCC64_09615 [Streptomyces sp. JNUCC 64]